MTEDEMAQDEHLVKFREQVQTQIVNARAVIEPALPAGVSFERTLARLVVELSRDAKLAECYPSTIFWAFVQAAELGLDIGGSMGEAFIIGYASKDPSKPKRARLVIGYPGLVRLAYRSQLISVVNTYVVYERDMFDVSGLGRNEVVYGPYLGDDPGRVVAGYCQIQLTTGGVKHFVMPLRDLDAIRLNVPGHDKPDSPWRTHRAEMYRKTALRHGLKDAPRSSELQRAIQIDQLSEADVDEPAMVDLGRAAEPRVSGRVAESRARLEAAAAGNGGQQRLLADGSAQSAPATGTSGAAAPAASAKVASASTKALKAPVPQPQAKVPSPPEPGPQPEPAESTGPDPEEVF
jgi:recombination protein RecT